MIATKNATAEDEGLLPRSHTTRVVWLVALLICMALSMLPEVIRLDGSRHADWQQFLGRFHPLAVHIPIGLIALVPLLEIVGAFRPALREAAGFVLSLACAACLGTLLLGYLLAYGSGDSGSTVTRHMWGGIILSISMLLCLLTRPMWTLGTLPHVYPLLLVFAMLALIWTAHQGGSLTHGETFLTEYMPAPLKRFLPLGNGVAGTANPDSFYAKQIHPILNANCVGCHGTGKTQGGLRLDSYQLLMKGGKDGSVVLPRNAEQSLLLQRITLPTADHHFMPAEGRPPLKPNEIALLRAWIQQGASATSTTIAGVSLPEGPKQLPLQPVGDYNSMMDEIRSMQHSQGAKLVPVSSKPSDGLVLNTVDVASTFGDAELARFQKFAPYIVEVDLARTTVTDASFETLSRFTHLRAIHLEGTAVTGNGIGKLTPLTQLTYLNLSNTRVAPDALSPLKAMPNLQHVYLFNTPAQPATTADNASPTARSTQ